MRWTRTQLDKAIAGVVAEAREAAGLSQRALSARIERGSDFVRKVEACESTLQIYDLLVMARALDVAAVELVARIVRRL